MVARGQLGINMYFAKPEKSAFRLDGSTIFTKLYISPWTRFGRPWGCLGRSWGRLGRPWGHLGGPSWRTLEKPWKNLLKEASGSTLESQKPQPPSVNLLLD